MHIDPACCKATRVEAAPAPVGWGEFLIDLVPTSGCNAFAQGNILQVLVFSVFVCMRAREPRRDGAAGSPGGRCGGQIFVWIIRKAMLMPPCGLRGDCLTVAQFGLATLLPLAALVGEFFLTCVLFFALVLAPIAWAAGFNLLRLMRYIREELVLVLGTSSSESVFPQLTQKLTRLGVDESVVGIVLPTGYSFNHDGTCLYFAAVSVFLAQATGTALGWEQQLALLAILLILQGRRQASRVRRLPC